MKARLSRLEREHTNLKKTLNRTRKINEKLMREVNELRARLWGNPLAKREAEAKCKAVTQELLRRSW